MNFNPDADKDPEYIKRRDWLLARMKVIKWDDEGEKPLPKKKGPKPEPKLQPKLDQTKTRNKFFKFGDDE